MAKTVPTRSFGAKNSLESLRRLTEVMEDEREVQILCQRCFLSLAERQGFHDLVRHFQTLSNVINEALAIALRENNEGWRHLGSLYHWCK